MNIDYDKKMDVLYITLGTGEPSYCEEVDDILLVERSFATKEITGFRILDASCQERLSTKGKKKIVAYGYIKYEDGFYTAICVNMGLFGQGKTPEEAFRKAKKAIASYIEFVSERYPDECGEFLNRSAPDEFVKEFKKSSEPFCILGGF